MSNSNAFYYDCSRWEYLFSPEQMLEHPTFFQDLALLNRPFAILLSEGCKMFSGQGFMVTEF